MRIDWKSVTNIKKKEEKETAMTGDYSKPPNAYND